jgi:membrane protein implicated in regulation of membrane protease activity
MRALLTFFTLFFWAAALYVERGGATSRVFGISALWGLAGMSAVAGLLHVLPKLAHSGTRDLESALNAEALVYLDIPANGIGEIRVAVSGSVCHIKARSVGGAAIPAGTPVTVCSRYGQTILVVKPISKS